MSLGLLPNLRAATNAMSISLAYGYEAVLPIEIQLPSLHIALALEMITENNHKSCLQDLESLD